MTKNQKRIKNFCDNSKQTYIFCLKLKILILVTENCLEIEDVLKFESLAACKGKKATFG